MPTPRPIPPTPRSRRPICAASPWPRSAPRSVAGRGPRRLRARSGAATVRPPPFARSLRRVSEHGYDGPRLGRRDEHPGPAVPRRLGHRDARGARAPRGAPRRAPDRRHASATPAGRLDGGRSPARPAERASRSCTSSSSERLAPEELAAIEDAVRETLSTVRVVVDRPRAMRDRLLAMGDLAQTRRSARSHDGSRRTTSSCSAIASTRSTTGLVGRRSPGSVSAGRGPQRAYATPRAAGPRRASPARRARRPRVADRRQDQPAVTGPPARADGRRRRRPAPPDGSRRGPDPRPVHARGPTPSRQPRRRCWPASSTRSSTPRTSFEGSHDFKAAIRPVRLVPQGRAVRGARR